jgi:hypothetical protein
MNNEKHPCACCGRPGDVTHPALKALCWECREKVARQDNAEACARQEAMNLETEPHP